LKELWVYFFPCVSGWDVRSCLTLWQTGCLHRVLVALPLAPQIFCSFFWLCGLFCTCKIACCMKRRWPGGRKGATSAFLGLYFEATIVIVAGVASVAVVAAAVAATLRGSLLLLAEIPIKQETNGLRNLFTRYECRKLSQMTLFCVCCRCCCSC